MIKIHKKWMPFVEVFFILILYWGWFFSWLKGMGDDRTFVNEFFNPRDGSIYWAIGISLLTDCFLFFGNIYYMIPKYLKKKKIKTYIVCLAFIFIGLIGLEEVLNQILLAVYHLPENLETLYGNIGGRSTVDMPYFETNIYVLIISFGYSYIKEWKHLMEERARQQALLAEKWKVELNFLKSQVNPHFLFNNLNNIYAIAKRNNDSEAAEAITRVSNLSRFMLYDSNSKFIPIEKELEYIKDYIEIQQLRYAEDEVLINLKLEGDFSTKISPFMLIPFVENAFKYGVKIHQKNVIKIELKIVEKTLFFKVKNKIQNTKSNHVYSGIGITNVKKRLDLIYKDNYNLNIDNDSEYFEVTLRIDNL